MFPRVEGLSRFLRSVSIRPAFENRHSDCTEVTVIAKSERATLANRGKDLSYT